MTTRRLSECGPGDIIRFPSIPEVAVQRTVVLAPYDLGRVSWIIEGRTFVRFASAVGQPFSEPLIVLGDPEVEFLGTEWRGRDA